MLGSSYLTIVDSSSYHLAALDISPCTPKIAYRKGPATDSSHGSSVGKTPRFYSRLLYGVLQCLMMMARQGDCYRSHGSPVVCPLSSHVKKELRPPCFSNIIQYHPTFLFTTDVLHNICKSGAFQTTMILAQAQWSPGLVLVHNLPPDYLTYNQLGGFNLPNS